MPAVRKPRPKCATFLRHWRKYRILTQEAAADRIGMDRTVLSKIECGIVPYDQALLERAAVVYGCKPADLLTRDPNNPIWALLDMVRKLPEPEQKKIAGMIKGYIDNLEEVPCRVDMAGPMHVNLLPKPDNQQ